MLQHLAARFGITRHQSANRIWEAKTADGLVLRANLDGSASWQGRSANELLDEFLQPFLDGVPQADIAHLLAINDGVFTSGWRTVSALLAQALSPALALSSHDDEDKRRRHTFSSSA